MMRAAWRTARNTARFTDATSPDMLISLRSRGASWVVKGLFVVLIGSFALWGIPDVYRNMRSEPVAATIDGTAITAAELRRAVDHDLKQLQNRLGNQIEVDQFRPRFTEQGLDTMIERRVRAAHCGWLPPRGAPHPPE